MADSKKAQEARIAKAKAAPKTPPKDRDYGDPFQGQGMPEKYDVFYNSIRRASKKYNIPEEVLYAVLHKESSGNFDATGSDKTGQGAWQIDIKQHPEFFKDPANKQGRDVDRATDYAAKYLDENRRRLGGDLNAAISAYNAGVGGVRTFQKYGKDPDYATYTGDYRRQNTSDAKYFRKETEPLRKDAEKLEGWENEAAARQHYAERNRRGEQLGPTAPDATPLDGIPDLLKQYTAPSAEEFAPTIPERPAISPRSQRAFAGRPEIGASDRPIIGPEPTRPPAPDFGTSGEAYGGGGDGTGGSGDAGIEPEDPLSSVFKSLSAPTPKPPPTPMPRPMPDDAILARKKGAQPSPEPKPAPRTDQYLKALAAKEKPLEGTVQGGGGGGSFFGVPVSAMLGATPPPPPPPDTSSKTEPVGPEGIGGSGDAGTDEPVDVAADTGVDVEPLGFNRPTAMRSPSPLVKDALTPRAPDDVPPLPVSTTVMEPGGVPATAPVPVGTMSGSDSESEEPGASTEVRAILRPGDAPVQYFDAEGGLTEDPTQAAGNEPEPEGETVETRAVITPRGINYLSGGPDAASTPETPAATPTATPETPPAPPESPTDEAVRRTGEFTKPFEGAYESALDQKALRSIRPPEELDRTPVDLGSAKTTEYDPLADRDWRAEFMAADDAASRDRLYSQLARAVSNLGAGISGFKGDTGVADALETQAAGRAGKVDREMRLDALARKAREEKMAKDPTSSTNRTAQKLFADRYPWLARGREKEILKMTGDQLASMLKDDSEYQRSLADIKAKDTQAFLAAQSALQEDKKAASENLSKQGELRVRALHEFMQTGRGGPGSNRMGINQTESTRMLERYVKETKPEFQMLNLLENIAQAAPGIFENPAGQTEILSMPEVELESRFGQLLSRFGARTQNIENKQLFMQATAALDSARGKDLYGTALSSGEQRMFDRLMGKEFGSRPEARIMAFQILARGLARQAVRRDAALKMQTQYSGDFYDQAHQNKITLTSSPFLRGHESIAGDIPMPMPSRQPGQPPPTGPAAAAGTKPTITRTGGKGTPEDPFTFSDGAKMIRGPRGLIPVQ